MKNRQKLFRRLQMSQVWRPSTLSTDVQKHLDRALKKASSGESSILCLLVIVDVSSCVLGLLHCWTTYNLQRDQAFWH